ncbi:hypothetical protein llg_29060 [Luteolibacter sp. LG18]|nr:hypothetical protein llg_29060 [Luteolibacter sp. LG18]
MFPLGLAPLPITRAEGETPESAGWDDFVSAEAVREVLSGACSGRLSVSPLDMGLSSSDEDFASLSMPLDPEPRVFAPVVWPEAIAEDAAFSRRIFTPVFDPVETRATPPQLPAWEGAEAGLASRAGYQWWIPGIVGIAATFMLSAILFLFSQQAVPFQRSLETTAPALVTPLPAAPDTALKASEQQGKEPEMAAMDFGNP